LGFLLHRAAGNYFVQTKNFVAQASACGFQSMQV
jgi:hypothetical protein